jgi:hypothetical protein
VKSTTLRLSVKGDNHEELEREIDLSVRKYLLGWKEEEEPDESISYGYEMSVSEIDDDFSEFLYQAEVLVRIKNA